MPSEPAAQSWPQPSATRSAGPRSPAATSSAGRRRVPSRPNPASDRGTGTPAPSTRAPRRDHRSRGIQRRHAAPAGRGPLLPGGEAWPRWFARVELPTWLLYPRGAGRAVIAAARAWADGHPPWIPDHRRSQRGGNPVTDYFRAGANGVAMRVAPHAVVTVTGDTATLLTRVVTDGITSTRTSACPGRRCRACAGIATRPSPAKVSWNTANLVETLMEDRSWQDADWLPDTLPNEWVRTFEATTHQPIMTAWKATVLETRELLQIALRSLARAALANDEQTLGALGCYDKARNGSGTITAVAAAYVATRAAARPLTGLLRTAFLPKAEHRHTRVDDRIPIGRDPRNELDFSAHPERTGWTLPPNHRNAASRKPRYLGLRQANKHCSSRRHQSRTCG